MFLFERDKHPYDHIPETVFLGATPLLDGTHFSRKSQNSYQAVSTQSGHAIGMACDLSELLEQTRPPNPELADLIERAFLAHQIDGQRADLAYLWLMPNRLILTV